MKISSHQLGRYLLWGILGFCIAMLTVIPVRLAIAHYQMPQPQAFVTLDGKTESLSFTANFARYFPSLDIWICTNLPAAPAQSVFQQAGIAVNRLHFVPRSGNTVTHFTSLLDEFQQQQIQHVYLFVPEFYMLRATVIAYLIWGSEGLAYTPVVIPTKLPREPYIYTLQDIGRSITWLFFNRRMHHSSQ